MNIKKTITNLVKISAAGAASLIFSSDVEAQLPGQQINSPRGQYQQQLVDTAPQLLHAQQRVPANQSRSGANLQPQQRVASRPPQASQARTFVPPHLRSSGVKQVNYSASRFANTNTSEGEYIGGESIVGGGCGAGGCSGGCGVDGCGIDGPISYEMGYDDYGVGCGDGCADMCGDYSADPCGYRRYPSLISFSDMEFFGGGLAFKGPVNLGQGGSFGFHEGINWGFPVPLFQGLGLSGQLGFTATQTNANGAGFTAESREQYFVTGGMFRRVDYGLQFGVVYDYLQENFYFDGAFAQVRGDVGWVGVYGNTFGFRFTTEADFPSGTGAIATALVPSSGPFNDFIPANTYRFYWEQPLRQSGGVFNVFGGFTGNGNSQGIVGGTISVPLTEQMMLKSSGTILIDGGEPAEANIDENWNISVGLVYMPKGWCAWKRAYHRPLFDVADNSSFLLGRD